MGGETIAGLGESPGTRAAPSRSEVAPRLGFDLVSSPSIRPDYESQTVRITDLAVIEDKIEGKVFSNCQIVGPAILAPMNSTLSGCVFDVVNNDPESVLIIVPDRWLVGAIAIVRCEFYGCRFSRIGLIGGGDLAKAFREATQPPPS